MLCRQLLPEQCQVEAVHQPVFVEIGGFSLGFGKGNVVGQVGLEQEKIIGCDFVVGVEVAGECVIHSNFFVIKYC